MTTTKTEEAWRVVGFMTREPIVICPGVVHTNTASCEQCGQAIRHVVSMLSSNGNRLDVGEDCAITLAGGDTLRQVRNAQRAWERAEDERLHGADRRAAAIAKAAREVAQGQENEILFGLVLFAARAIVASVFTSNYDGSHAARLIADLITGQRTYGLDSSELVWLGQAYRAATSPASSHVGTVGGKFATTATLERRHGFDTAYGRKWILTFRAECGAILVWFTTAGGDQWEADLGSVVTIKGTVKEHSEYKGTKQTVMTRCKVLK